MASSTMSSDSSNLSTLARSKLHLSVGGSLHRWVLLKNSIIRSQPLTSTTATTDHPDVNHVYSLDDGDDDDDEVGAEEEEDSFMFPDAGKLVDNKTADVNTSEAQWLDSLLETLGDDDDDDFNVDSDVHVSAHPVDDDEDQLLSPLMSPLSSSDDLPNQLTYYPPPTPLSYPIPYPPFHPPLINSYEFDPTFDSSLTSISSPYDNPLPYLDDVEDLSIPDAIEDTSDDESEAPPTPSLGQSTSLLSLVDPASIPLPAERSRRRHPLVFINTDDSYFYPFELDPLPFPDDRHSSYNGQQEC
jgi:hypothetical protein